jgi:pyrrolidone-carboxylate peptidase
MSRQEEAPSKVARSAEYYRCARIYYRMMRDLGIQPRESFAEFLRNAILLYLGYKDDYVITGVDASHLRRFIDYFDAAYSAQS